MRNILYIILMLNVITIPKPPLDDCLSNDFVMCQKYNDLIDIINLYIKETYESDENFHYKDIKEHEKE